MTDRVAQMLMNGDRDRDLIANGIVTPGRLAYIKRKARASGVVFPRNKPRKPNSVKTGSLRDCLVSLTDDEARWLLVNLPDKSSVAEFCVALIRDAAAEC